MYKGRNSSTKQPLMRKDNKGYGYTALTVVLYIVRNEVATTNN